MVEKRGLCGICPAGCWVIVGIENGRLKSIRPEEGHPLGMICRRGEHSPEIIYSEHRLHHPLKRTGPRGTYQFKRIGWDEAYSQIIERMEAIKRESGPEAVSIYTGRGAFELALCDIFQPKEAAVSSASSLLFPFGSPNTMGVGALCYVSFAMIAPHVTMGRMLINMFTDMENAELLVIWGANPYTDSPPLDMYRLEAAGKRGADIVSIDPRFTEAAARTDARWIPIRPGTDGALALSMIEVLIEEDLYDEDFVENWTHGFEELARYTRHFRPEQVEGITGVPAETIRDLARKIAAAAGAAPVMYTGLEYSNSGIQAIRAVLTLFALAGQLDVPGGIGLAMQNSHFPINRDGLLSNPDLNRAVARDRFPIYSRYRGESHAIGLVESVLKGRPYPVRALLIHGASLLTSWPQTALWRETLSGLDFIVSIDRQLTADCAYADIVLPATTMFEIESYMTYGPLFRIREKLIEPVGEARDDYLIMAGLAERLGYGHLYPQTREEVLRHVLKGSGFTPEDVRMSGGMVEIPPSVMEYKKWTKGALRTDGRPGFDTPTGKFEILSTLLDDDGYEPLPKYTEPREGPVAAPELAEDYPLVFNSGARSQSFFRSQHHGIKGLLKDHPEPFVEMNTADAEVRGIQSGDLVEVTTPRGSVRFRSLVSDKIVRGAVECNMGGGGPIGPKEWQASNVNDLTDLDNYDDISGFPVYKALLCQVRKMADDGVFREHKAVRKSFDSNALFSVPAAKREPVNRVYLDNNATTAVHPEVLESMLPFFRDDLGNPSSLHAHGRRTRDAVEAARRQVAGLINCRPRRLVMTGGGSESDNLALKGIAFRHFKKKGHIITTTVEHPAVLQACRFLEDIGFRVSYLVVDEAGMVHPDVLEEAILKDTLLVSIMTANNETGTILPIRTYAAIAHAHGVLFHTDAVQALGKIPVDVEELDVDFLTLSAHKFHGPKGMGALYVRKGIALEPLIHGGKQEHGLRAGTENTPAIVGFGRAAEMAANNMGRMASIQKLRDKLEEGLIRLFPDTRLNGHRTDRLPNTLNMVLPGYRGESIAIAMDQKGISFSSGSACKTGSPDPSHALLALGLRPEDAHCSVRLSLSIHTTAQDIERTLKAFEEVKGEMGSTIRFLPCK